MNKRRRGNLENLAETGPAPLWEYTGPSQSLPNHLSSLSRYGRCHIFSIKPLLCPEGAAQTLTNCLESCHLSQRLLGLKTTGWKIGKVWKRGVGRKWAYCHTWHELVGGTGWFLLERHHAEFACWGPTSRVQFLNQSIKYGFFKKQLPTVTVKWKSEKYRFINVCLI